MKIAVLASGSGTNLQALIDTPSVYPHIEIVVSDREGAPALDRAGDAGVQTDVVSWSGYPDRESFCDALAGTLDRSGVDLIVLAGFMRILTPRFVQHFPGRIVNVHPSLLPAFPGIDAVRQALDHGVKVTGVTVHIVDEGVDTGPIIAQRSVPVYADDDEEALHARIQIEEHQLLPEVIAAIVNDPVEAGVR